jgi:hypothetical protein
MIFSNSHLMSTERDLYLYLVTNPTPFKRYEDHHAALQIQMDETIEQAIEDGEDPVALIESYLDLTYNGGSTIEEISNFLWQTDQQIMAMHTLKDRWAEIDESLPEPSLSHGGTSRKQAVQVFSEITLRSYLEALSKVYNG